MRRVFKVFWSWRIGIHGRGSAFVNLSCFVLEHETSPQREHPPYLELEYSVRCEVLRQPSLSLSSFALRP